MILKTGTKLKYIWNNPNWKFKKYKLIQNHRSFTPGIVCRVFKRGSKFFVTIDWADGTKTTSSTDWIQQNCYIKKEKQKHEWV